MDELKAAIANLESKKGIDKKEIRDIICNIAEILEQLSQRTPSRSSPSS